MLFTAFITDQAADIVLACLACFRCSKPNKVDPFFALCHVSQAHIFLKDLMLRFSLQPVKKPKFSFKTGGSQRLANIILVTG